MHIQCEAELRRRFDPVKAMQNLVAGDCASAILGNWHASVVDMSGSQFLLYIHTKSLYSAVDFIDPDDDDASAIETVHNLQGKILDMLSEHYYLTDYQENGIIQPFKQITVGPIEDRRILRIAEGMTIAYQKRFIQARNASSHGEVRLWELEDDINNVSRRNLGGASPEQILCQLIWSGVN